MSRIEVIARGFLVIGLLAGVGTVGVILWRNAFGTSAAPPVSELGPLLGKGEVVHDHEREDLGTSDKPGRSVLLSIPAAINQEEARTELLSVLKRSGWLVARGGGAVPPQGAVCLALSTPTDWLADRANAQFKQEFEQALEEASTIAVVVDMFFCSRTEP
jgi:hypothetical protein